MAEQLGESRLILVRLDAPDMSDPFTLVHFGNPPIPVRRRTDYIGQNRSIRGPVTACIRLFERGPVGQHGVITRPARHRIKKTCVAQLSEGAADAVRWARCDGKSHAQANLFKSGGASAA
jgi:hypothetical protein